MGETAAAVTAVKSGALVALIALLTTDVNLLIVLIVGSIIGVIVYLKEITHPDAPDLTKSRHFVNFVMTIFIVLSVTGSVFFFGVELINSFYPLGIWFWVFTSVIISQHYKQIWKIMSYIGEEILAPVLKKLSDAGVQIIKKWFGS